MSSKKQLLDPIGTMCKIIMLNFVDKHSKICFKDHAIYIQKPDNLQWLVRKYQGDGREDVSELFPVIIRLIRWYILPMHDILSGESDIDSDSDYNIEFYKNIKKLVEYMCSGFELLQDTYSTGNVVYCIQYFINLLKDALDGEFNEECIPKSIIEYEKKQRNLLDYDKIKHLWDKKQVLRLTELFDNCFKTLHDISFEKDITRKIVKGYLKTIRSILDLTDQQFLNLIQYSLIS
jgi:hypothetical protein